jgi:hypothetical protein
MVDGISSLSETNVFFNYQIMHFLFYILLIIKLYGNLIW